MEKSDFLNLKTLLNTVAKDTKSTDSKKDGIRDATSVKVCITSPGFIFFKYSYSTLESWTKVRMFKKQPGRRRKNQVEESLTAATLRETLENVPILNPEGRKINSLKHRDLLSLLPFIPSIHHELYTNFKPAKEKGNEEEENDFSFCVKLIWTVVGY